MMTVDLFVPFQRDYGTLLMNRVGRKGYKIMVQVVGLLWDFRCPVIQLVEVSPECSSCGQTGPARYIPTWPSLAWVMELVSKRDQSCVKLVRSKDPGFLSVPPSSPLYLQSRPGRDRRARLATMRTN